MAGTAPASGRSGGAAGNRRSRLLSSLGHPSWQGVSALIGVAGVVVAVIAWLGPGEDSARLDVGASESPGASPVTSGQSGSHPTPTASSAVATGPRSLIDIPLIGGEFERGFGPGPLKALDGTATRSVTVTVGEVKTIDVPVSGALRISLRAEILKAWACSGHAMAAWVEPSFS